MSEALETKEGENGVTQRGTEDAEHVADLWEREAADLLRYAMVRVGNDQAAAEDLVQRTFLAAFRTWPSLAGREPDAQRGWLRSVCRNKWIDGIRRANNLEQLQPDLNRLFACVAPDPADVVLARSDLDRCWQVIQTFPPRRRQIALLYFIEQHSEMRIAEMLGLHPSGVRKHVAQARKDLRSVIGGISTEGTPETATPQTGEGERT
ncbi:sigma-70 family RNA polymerase sigma factor [Streptomyces sp. NPDC093109]|uniref:RNA polymerase sigma factor n=1 Tax=Streptomyces sp. NPDC093109 TaxID=3154977 RepID=UPI00344C6933